MTEPRWLSDEEQRAWRAFLHASGRLTTSLDRQLERDAGIPHAYYVTLAMLSERPDRSCTMSELAEATQFSPSRLSHSVSKLEAQGWVTRRRADGNARQIIATLTDEGMAVVEAAAPVHVEHVRRIVFDDLSPEQVTAFREVCESVLAHLDDDLDGA